MKYSEYGKTGKKVSAVGFGGMRFNMEKSLEENANLILYSHGKGINYFDTAPGYCNDKSEDIFGIALKKLKRNDFCISTKGMPERVPTAEQAYELVCKSLERLNVDSIDFYHIWCLRHMNHYNLAVRKGGQYDGLLKAKEEGLIKHIVCSSHQQGLEVKNILQDGKVEGVLMGINILNFPYRWEAAQFAKSNGFGVVAMNPLGGGIIPESVDNLKFICGKDDKSAIDAALRFNIACPEITVSLVGFSCKEHIDNACDIAENSEPFSKEDLDRISKHLSENMNAVCTTCGYCKGCPKNIRIPDYMQYYNRKIMFKQNDDQMKERLKHESTWGILVGPKSTADECIECGVCEEKCTQHLPIIERLKEIAAWEKEITGE